MPVSEQVDGSTIVLESTSFMPHKHRSILLNLFDLENISVDDVMVPRPRIEGALRTIACAIAPTLAETAVDAAGIAHGLRAQCEKLRVAPVHAH